MIRMGIASGVALVLALAVMGGCSSGGGGGGSGNPALPAEVNSILVELESGLRGGQPDLPATITLGQVNNPLDINVDNLPSEPIASSGDDHAGTVANVDYFLQENRNANGSGQIVASIVDSAEPSREFLDYTANLGAFAISFEIPPIGATEFLATDGTGQSFMIMTVDRTINWSRTFTNDPTGSISTGTLVEFSPAGLPVIPSMLDGIDLTTGTSTISGTTVQHERYLVESVIRLGPSGNEAKIVNIWKIGDAEEVRRSGSGLTVSRIVHSHTVTAGPTASQQNARTNAFTDIVDVGTDADIANTIVDGDELNVSNGTITGGIAGYAVTTYVSKVNNAGNALILVDDSVPAPTDGDFDAVSAYNIMFNIDVTAGPGGLNNGTVEVSILKIDSEQVEDPAMQDTQHPVIDEEVLYGMVGSDTQTGAILYR